jgi:hypothetical protein
MINELTDYVDSSASVHTLSAYQKESKENAELFVPNGITQYSATDAFYIRKGSSRLGTLHPQ